MHVQVAEGQTANNYNMLAKTSMMALTNVYKSTHNPLLVTNVITNRCLLQAECWQQAVAGSLLTSPLGDALHPNEGRLTA